MYKIQCIKAHDPYQPMSFNDWHGAPTENQKIMIEAVEKALLQGLFYNSDIYSFVKKEMSNVLSDDIFDDIKNGTNKTEFGAFGTDIYRARIAVEKMLQYNANIQAMEKLQSFGLLDVGKKLKNVKFSGKIFSTCVVDSIQDGMVELIGKRRGVSGSFKFAMGANDTRLLTAITEKVKDNSVKIVSEGNGFTSVQINLAGNYSQELKLQF